MADIILHHYETSPYAEKIRVAFGIKGLAWSSVEIPRIMPKPDLMPLTGGYRKTPVLQIGADIFCDTQRILREIDAIDPEPPLNPHPGVGDALAWWAEKAMFTPSVIVGFAHIADQLPEDFKQDRAKFSGRNFDPAAMKAALPYQLDQLRAHFGWLDRALADGRKFLLGEQAGTPDLAAYQAQRRKVGGAARRVFSPAGLGRAHGGDRSRPAQRAQFAARARDRQSRDSRRGAGGGGCFGSRRPQAGPKGQGDARRRRQGPGYGRARALERAGDRDQARRPAGRRRARAFPARRLRRIRRVM